jgi:hypothetical protein
MKFLIGTKRISRISTTRSFFFNISCRGKVQGVVDENNPMER